MKTGWRKVSVAHAGIAYLIVCVMCQHEPTTEEIGALGLILALFKLGNEKEHLLKQQEDTNGRTPEA